ncbi:MAG: TIGR02452 family protein, partial [Firmicutes bacterium]|nr:TIGR02452 family protein [Bacillota bacterium]
MPRSNWTRKEEMSKKALEHTEYMALKYKNEIADCIKNSVVLRDTEKASPTGTPKISVSDMGTVDAAFIASGKVTVLNFASYKHPGGGFITGAIAQEEALCHESFLYNVISTFTDYYEYNQKNLCKGLYTNAAIYSPDVVFECGGQSKKVNVITCAAPNNSLGVRYKAFTPEENKKALESRINFVRDIAEKYGCDTLVLGAFGCGVFKQDPTETAQIFKKTFARSDIKNIIYAI